MKKIVLLSLFALFGASFAPVGAQYDYYGSQNDHAARQQQPNHYGDQGGFNGGFQNQAPQHHQGQHNQYQASATFVPPNTPLIGTTKYSIAASTANFGDEVRVGLSSPLYAGNRVVVAPGEGELIMRVVELQQPGRAGKNGRMVLEAVAVSHRGQRIPVQATRYTVEADRGRAGSLASGATKGAAVGALGGLLTGSLANGRRRLGSNTAIGTGIGAGVGALFSKGQDAILPSGSTISISTLTPIRIGGNAPPPQHQGGYY